jgi:molybdate transport system ATP-binding protein
MLQVDVLSYLGAFELNVRFTGADHGVTVLFGPSGAGKSSVLSAVSGARAPDAGRIVLDGETLFDSAQGIDVPMEHRRIGWVFQDARLFPHLDVEANLRFGLKRAPDGPVRFDDVVEVLGIGRLLRRRPRELSGGERQRVGLGRALLSQPRLLLMDEPLASLDASRRREILPFFERIKGQFGVPILYVTHSLAEAVRLGDRMIILDEGRVTAEGPLGEVIRLANGSAVREGAILDGAVLGHDGGLSVIRVGGWDIRTPWLDARDGAPVRLFVLARDVMLALDPPGRISARNVLPGTILSLTADGGRVLARVVHENQEMLCALTLDAVQALGLGPGMAVHLVVKSVAVEGLDGGLLAALED